MRDLYMKNGQGFILVYSITSQATFSDLLELRDQILRVKDAPFVPMVSFYAVFFSFFFNVVVKLYIISKVLVGNKSDLGLSKREFYSSWKRWELKFFNFFFLNFLFSLKRTNEW